MLISRIKNAIDEYPMRFWVLVGAMFIDTIGSTLLFPFFALYITQKFNVGMTQAGALLAIFSVFGMVGNMIGGALTDKFGRRGMVIFGLVASALSSLSMGLVNELSLFYLLAVIVGLFSNIGGPARQAMVADLLPEQQRAEGFGMLRVAGNLAWIIGPSIGGLLASHSYLSLFVLDAVASLITAAIVYRFIPETKPQILLTEAQPGFWETLVGYRQVAADKTYMVFLATSMLMLIVYQQLYSTLSVYLRDVHGISTQGYGLLMSLNAGTVVVLQLRVTQKIKKYAPLLMMAVGAGFYMVGFTMYGLVTTYSFFVIAMLIITCGEMIVVPVSQSLAASFAPQDMRGRYMAFFGLSWTLPTMIGPWAAGLIMDYYNPNWVWYAGGIISMFAIAGFYALHLRTQPRLTSNVSKEQAPVLS